MPFYGQTRWVLYEALIGIGTILLGWDGRAWGQEQIPAGPQES